jgi:hypothetical protein
MLKDSFKYTWFLYPIGVIFFLLFFFVFHTNAAFIFLLYVPYGQWKWYIVQRNKAKQAKKKSVVINNSYKSTVLSTNQANILIATVLMNWRVDDSFPDKGRVYRSEGGAIEMDTTFKFHTDYNLMMKVVDKLFKMGYATQILSRVDTKTYIVSVYDINNGSILFSKESKLANDAIHIVLGNIAEWINLGKPTNITNA